MQPNPVPLLRTLLEHSQLPPNNRQAPGTGHPCPAAAINVRNAAYGLSQDTHHSVSPIPTHPNRLSSLAAVPLQPAWAAGAGAASRAAEPAGQTGAPRSVLTPKQSLGGEKAGKWSSHHPWGYSKST